MSVPTLGVREHPGPEPLRRAVVDVPGQGLVERGLAGEARVEVLPMEIVEDGAHHRDTGLVQPLVQHLGVVVLVLRESDLQTVDVAEPLDPRPPFREPWIPALAEERRVEDDRVEAEMAEPGRGAVNGVVREDLRRFGETRQRLDVLLCREPGRTRARGVVKEENSPHVGVRA